jgi:hypothetical protein
MTINEVMPREVCLKHQKNRREIFLRVRASKLAAVFVLFVIERRGCAQAAACAAPFAIIVQKQDA